MIPSFLRSTETSTSTSAYTKLATEDGNNIPLLPTTQSQAEHEEDSSIRHDSYPQQQSNWLPSLHTQWHPKWRLVIGVLGSLVALFILGGIWALWPESIPDTSTSHPVQQTPPPANTTQPKPTITDPKTLAHERVEALFAQQSTTLSQARSRYTLKAGHEPPQHYDEFFAYAKEKQCLIDDYDQIHLDFAPFYQLAAEDPTFFSRRLDHGFDLAIKQSIALKAWEIKNRKAQAADSYDASYTTDWQHVLNLVRVTPFLFTRFKSCYLFLAPCTRYEAASEQSRRTSRRVQLSNTRCTSSSTYP